MLLIAASIFKYLPFEYFAILVLKLGIAGASGATILAQMISVLFLFWHIKRKVPEFQISKIYGG
jgi:hypothetical protein